MKGTLVRRAGVVDAAQIARIGVDTWRSSYYGIVPDEFLKELAYDARQQRFEAILADPERKASVFVAEAAPQGIVGFASCGPERANDIDYLGELYSMYVSRPMQRTGIGRRLTRSVAEDLKARGLGSMLVWVLEQNPSRGFYEAIGGTQVKSKPVVIGGRSLTAIGYGWKNLDSLLELL